MNKTRLFSLFVLVFAGILLAACDTALPPGVEIQVANDAQSAEVEFTGKVDSIAADQWVIQGFTVLVNPQTVIDGVFVAGDVAHVYAIVEINGAVTATRIEGFTPEPESTPTPGTDDSSAPSFDEAEFIGVVESIAPDRWIVSGQTFLVTAQTEIKDAILVGDTVKAHVYLNESNAFIASEIELVLNPSVVGSSSNPGRTELELTGVVEAIAVDLWAVSGLQFAVNAQTEIKDVIAIGDWVEVHLHVNPDNTLTAHEIELAESDDIPPALGMLELTGLVESMAPDSWTIGGKIFVVTPQTEIKGTIAVGDTVKVEAIINPDSTLSATEIHKASTDNSDDDDGDDDANISTHTPQPTFINDEDDDDDDTNISTHTPQPTSINDDDDDDNDDNDDDDNDDDDNDDDDNDDD